MKVLRGTLTKSLDINYWRQNTLISSHFVMTFSYLSRFVAAMSLHDVCWFRILQRFNDWLHKTRILWRIMKLSKWIELHCAVFLQRWHRKYCGSSFKNVYKTMRKWSSYRINMMQAGVYQLDPHVFGHEVCVTEYFPTISHWLV